MERYAPVLVCGLASGGATGRLGLPNPVIMRAHLLPHLLACIPLCASAQTYSELDINNLRARFYADGMIGMEPGAGTPHFEAPNGSGTHPLFVANLWMGGLDAGNQLHLAAVRYNQNGEDYWPGPLSTDGSATITPAVSAQWDQVWKINTAEVTEFQAYCDCLQDPNCDENQQFPGYQIPNDFNTWPAIGDLQQGQDLYLAPFIDHNGDGDYNPSDCDAPCSPGDQSLYFIFNDKLNAHTESGGLPIGIEVQTRPFAFNGPNPALNNTVFVEYRIINRGILTLEDFHLGLFTDFDLGCPNDDHVGCDVGRSLWYAYNGTNNDSGAGCFGGVQGYGMQPPAFGATVLCGLYNDADGLDWTADSGLVAMNGFGTGDGALDNERQGLMHFSSFDNGAGAMGDPDLPLDYLRYMRGHWLDGTSWLYGGNGHFSDPDADQNTASRFLFPGDSDPQGLGTGGVPQSPWSEITAGNAPDDRRGVGSMGPVTLNPGDMHRVIVAFVYARAASGGPFASVEALQARVDSVRAFAMAEGYCAGFRQDVPCNMSTVTHVAEVEVPAPHLYPVPTSGVLRVVLDQRLHSASIRVFDALGRSVLADGSTGASRTLDVSSLAQGHYLLVAEAGALRSRARFIVE